MSLHVFERAWAASALSEFGVASWSELRAQGWTRRQIQRSIASGESRSIGKGVFATRAPLNNEDRWLQGLSSLVVRAGPSTVVTGPAAATLYGLDGFDHLSPFTVRVPACRQVSASADAQRATGTPEVIRRSRTPIRSDWIGPFPVASIATTLADLGLQLAPRLRWPGDDQPIEGLDLIELALECALHRGLVHLDELVTASSARTPGAAMLRAVLARRPIGAPATESFLETRFV